MKSWLSEIRFSRELDRMLEPEDSYYNKRVDLVLMPYDLELAQRKWERKNNKRKAVLA